MDLLFKKNTVVFLMIFWGIIKITQFLYSQKDASIYRNFRGFVTKFVWEMVFLFIEFSNNLTKKNKENEGEYYVSGIFSKIV